MLDYAKYIIENIILSFFDNYFMIKFAHINILL